MRIELQVVVAHVEQFILEFCERIGVGRAVFAFLDLRRTGTVEYALFEKRIVVELGDEGVELQPEDRGRLIRVVHLRGAGHRRQKLVESRRVALIAQLSDLLRILVRDHLVVGLLERVEELVFQSAFVGGFQFAAGRETLRVGKRLRLHFADALFLAGGGNLAHEKFHHLRFIIGVGEIGVDEILHERAGGESLGYARERPHRAVEEGGLVEVRADVLFDDLRAERVGELRLDSGRGLGPDALEVGNERIEHVLERGDRRIERLFRILRVGFVCGAEIVEGFDDVVLHDRGGAAELLCRKHARAFRKRGKDRVHVRLQLGAAHGFPDRRSVVVLQLHFFGLRRERVGARDDGFLRSELFHQFADCLLEGRHNSLLGDRLEVIAVRFDIQFVQIVGYREILERRIGPIELVEHLFAYEGHVLADELFELRRAAALEIGAEELPRLRDALLALGGDLETRGRVHRGLHGVRRRLVENALAGKLRFVFRDERVVFRGTVDDVDHVLQIAARERGHERIRVGAGLRHPERAVDALHVVERKNLAFD